MRDWYSVRGLVEPGSFSQGLPGKSPAVDDGETCIYFLLCFQVEPLSGYSVCLSLLLANAWDLSLGKRASLDRRNVDFCLLLRPLRGRPSENQQQRSGVPRHSDCIAKVRSLQYPLYRLPFAIYSSLSFQETVASGSAKCQQGGKVVWYKSPQLPRRAMSYPMNLNQGW